MKRSKVWTAITLPVLVASAVLTAAPSAGAASTGSVVTSGGASTQGGSLTCRFSGKAGVTNASTPVHTGASGSAPITHYLRAGEKIHFYFECINSVGNLWYEITGNIDENQPGTPVKARFIYSSYIN
ncbi:SH3 domain-containing protein [Streptomyces sp. NPDC007107]|uniref:SH3 domain-containing protein n=1 Tax=Streptomyces sp. NPDC007107 TaxID=3156915 RepID=UPI00340A0570